MNDTYVYKYGNNLYINLTNRCSNSCKFCIRSNGEGIGGNKLWLQREPSEQEIIALIDTFTDFEQIVFCGFGESTYRLDELISIAKFAKSKNYTTRLDTNGHGNVINGFDITKMLADCIDIVSVSLNQSNSQKYDEVCLPNFENSFDAMLDFAKKCVNVGIKTILSVVDVIPKEDIERCRDIASSIGAVLRVREYIDTDQ